jgi:ABC-2 type transport system permease protein
MIIVILATIAYPLVYGILYNNEVVRNVPIAVVDENSSSRSRKLINLLDATPDIEVLYRSASLEEAKELMKKGKVHGIVVIPSKFSSDIAQGIQTTIVTYADMSGFMFYKGLTTAASIVSYDYGMDIQIQNLENSGMTNSLAHATAEPVQIAEMGLYNAAAGYASYLIPPALALILHQTLIVAIGIVAGAARERKKYIQPGGILTSILGKAGCYFSVYIIIAIYILGIVPRIFSLPQYIDYWDIFRFSTPFILATTFFGMTMSVAFKDQESPFILFLFTSIPLLFLSGVTWPIENMPVFWKITRCIFPSSFGSMGFMKMNSMGASLHEVSTEYMGLWIQAGFYFMTTIIAYLWLSRQREKEKDVVILG